MKAYYTFLLSLFLSSAYAQSPVKGGKINYKETIQLQMNFDSDDPRMAEIKAMMPSSSSSEKELKFSETQSLYTNAEKSAKDEKQITTGENVTMSFNMEQPENIIFYDFTNEETLQQRSFMGRTFLVEGQTANKWKISGEQKEILGYKCTKAVLDDTTATSVWFTSEIAAFTGPDTYNGLPGLILEVEKKDRTIVATNIEVGTIESFAAPEKGKKVSVKQFNKIMAKKFEEMQAEFGGKGGNIMIIREEQ